MFFKSSDSRFFFASWWVFSEGIRGRVMNYFILFVYFGLLLCFVLVSVFCEYGGVGWVLLFCFIFLEVRVLVKLVILGSFRIFFSFVEVGVGMIFGRDGFCVLVYVFIYFLEFVWGFLRKKEFVVF